MKGFIPIAEPVIGEAEKRYVNEALDEGWVSSQGRFIERFEKGFADYCGVPHGVATSNGTTALHLALAALGVGAGDEVLIPSLTFIATANAVTYTGAKVVCCDVERDTWNLDAEDAAKKLTEKTTAVIPVHLYGHPADMDPLIELAADRDLLVVEDAAEAHGAEYKGRKVGSLGDAGVFSFYGNKIITTGEGGMVVTRDAELAERLRYLRDHAMSKEQRYLHPDVGYNYRMTNLQAALGCAQLEQLDAFINKKRTLAARYNDALKDVTGITLPPEKEWAKNVYWMYSVLVEDDYPLSRDELAAALKEKGIDTRPFFTPIHQQPPYKGQPRCPVAEELATKGINLPSGVTLTEEQVTVVCEVIKKPNPPPHTSPC